MLSFKPAFSVSSFTFIKRLFSSSLLSAVKVVSSAYLKLLIFLPEILIPDCVAFHMMYSAYKFKKQSDNIQLWHTPFWILNQSIGPRAVLNVFSWTAYRRQVFHSRGSGIPSIRIFHSFFVIHTVKGFSIVNEAKVDVSLELSYFFYDPVYAGNLIPGYSAFSKSSLHIWNSQFKYCWSLFWRILSIILLACEIKEI